MYEAMSELVPSGMVFDKVNNILVRSTYSVGLSNIQKEYEDSFKKETAETKELKEKNRMLRDDIVKKLTQLLEAEHTWLINLEEENTLEELDLSPPDITLFADKMIIEFDIDEIDFAKIMEWTTVKDMVDYIEDILEEGKSDE